MGGQQANSQEKFIRTLSASLHCLAQPLSIIQASLELALLNPTTVEQYREVAEKALLELGRATEAMHFAAQLTRFHQPAGDVSDVSLTTEIAGVLADLGRSLDAAQVRVVFAGPEHEPAVRFSGTRLRQLFFYVVQAIQDLSQPGDVVRLEVQSGAGQLVMRVFRVSGEEPAECLKMSASDSRANRALALADAIVTSGGGHFAASSHPLWVTAGFPVRREGRLQAAGKKSSGDSRLAASSH